MAPAKQGSTDGNIEVHGPFIWQVERPASQLTHGPQAITSASGLTGSRLQDMLYYNIT